MTQAEAARIRSRKSAYADQALLDNEQNKKRRWDQMAREESMSDQLRDKTSQSIMLYHCDRCNYKLPYTNAECKKMGHKTKRVSGKKYFFACTNCKHRVWEINKKYPVGNCRRCHGKTFAPAPVTELRVPDRVKDKKKLRINAYDIQESLRH
jgi:hypothetical protein